ncbi:MAG: redoxin domain-containing protein [Hyphomonas sp.]|uniref:redoxin family protein n=1 Tax=Hyphomonas sp. TaxID=87 RepID=UPI00180178C0|nr:redoxin family protein [Hyphomonas sp.]MBU3920946.1 redoxin family protein [Alphaproteobacteria bacterium]MBA3068621.1 redoxin domain-containing protein [Hyphomonas sp.]MBU4061940.1 redoxin family protein [Alphaproteobacteria bacterium]MBU4166095.1 redoxin family protein [Alphaproteobacteria bacterium]MBU4568663.1 redoxin family protein [Alphaproteobacteria bacterium]
MRRWVFALPVVVLVLFGLLGAWRMLYPAKGEFERVSRAAPEFVFELRDGGSLAFAPPPGGETVAVNLFASWCAPCEAEHPLLMKLGAAYPGQIYGILYKDTPENGDDFLARLGNPFTSVALDPEGRGGLDFGLTGVPETFVISANGDVILHINGPLDEASLKKISEALGAPRS